MFAYIRPRMIPIDILTAYDPAEIIVSPNAFLFMEGDEAHFYYQIIEGRVRMLNINEEGKEFVQGRFEASQSFGEPPLFHQANYPASAKTEVKTRMYKLGREKFLQLLREHPEVHLKFTATLTKRLMYKAMIMKEISSHDAQHRILTFLDYLKEEYGQGESLFPVELTRQQLSNLLGIRVETVIRTVKQLEDKGDIQLKGRKIFR